MPTAGQASRKLIYLYNQLDQFMREELKEEGPPAAHMNLVGQLAKGREDFRKQKKLLHLVADLRNLMVHRSVSAKLDSIVEPQPELLRLYARAVNELMRPPFASTCWVPRAQMFVCRREDRLLSVLEHMLAHGFSQVPVLAGERLDGVLTESSVMAWFARNRRLAFDETTLVGELDAALSLERGPGDVFEFLRVDSTLQRVQQLFAARRSARSRVTSIFFTTNGHPRGELVALMTAWDLMP